MRRQRLAAQTYGGDDLAVERPPAAVGLVEPGEEVEQRRLAGAVRTDQCGDGPPLDLEVIDLDGRETTECAPHVVGDEDRVRLGNPRLTLDLGGPGRARDGHRSLIATSRLSPRMPCGRKIINSISATPTSMNRTAPTLLLSMSQSGM